MWCLIVSNPDLFPFLTLSETTGSRATIFGMLHQIEKLYQLGSNIGSVAKMIPTQVHMFYFNLYSENLKKNLA